MPFLNLKDLQYFLDLAEVAIVATDAKGRIKLWNKVAEHLYGWSPEEALNLDACELFCVENPDLIEAISILHHNGHWRGEQLHKKKDARQFTVLSNWTLLLDDKGEKRGVVMVSRDLSEKKLLQNQLLRAQRLESIGTLASGIAHDLNNLLTPILMSAGILRLSAQNPEALKLCETIEGSAKCAAETIRHLLSFARGVQAEHVAMHPRDMLSELATIVGHSFTKNIAVHMHAPEDLWCILGDRTQLEQVLLNLCVNARDAMPEGGQLVVSAENIEFDQNVSQLLSGIKPGPHLLIKVADNGQGIPKEIMERIFDPFFTTKDLGKGSGLGLATARGIIKAHKGWLHLESQPGKGTTFFIYLPAAASELQTASKENDGWIQSSLDL